MSKITEKSVEVLEHQNYLLHQSPHKSYFQQANTTIDAIYEVPEQHFIENEPSHEESRMVNGNL